jgi:uncharacterized FAD-dependent dehydrogenase
MQPLTADVLIIGAGPAGLAAGSACRQSNVSYRICEAGGRFEQRVRSESSSLVQGIGGAGLYSDGKFSFFPSATQLWRLEYPAILQKSFHWLQEVVSPFGLTVPPLDGGTLFAESSVPPGGVRRKRYKSEYMSFDDRCRLIGMLAQEHKSFVTCRTTARLSVEEHGRRLACDIEDHGSLTNVIPRRGIIVATGRHGPLAHHSSKLWLPTEFRYVELGVRIEQLSGEFFLRDQPDLDPKLILHLMPGSECRTFCCCRDGEAVTTLTPEGVRSISGRADVGVTGRSNVGFNCRTTDEALGTQIWQEYRDAERAVDVHETAWMQGHELVGNESLRVVTNWIGPTAASLLMRGLANLIDAYPEIRTTRTRLLGPCVEGVGWYPAIDRSLRVAPYPLWVAGDATGIFRGLTASFVSGYYAGLCAALEVPKDR